jgi:hypothetical protein
MNDDVMAEFKNRRFVVASAYVLDRTEHVVILSDIGYWSEHYEELMAWCNQHNSEVQGMGVTLPDSHTLTLFALRWS